MQSALDGRHAQLHRLGDLAVGQPLDVGEDEHVAKLLGQFGNGLGITILLISAGAITAIPLLLFNGSTTRLPLTVIGLLQYITPTIQFAIGVWVRHEDMPTARWIGFLIIWIALITLAIDLVKSSRAVNNSIA